MLSTNSTHTHPVDQGLAGLSTNYTNYVSSGKTGTFTGNQANQGPFTSLVPFMLNQTDYATLKTYASSSATTGLPLNGPGANEQVSCLSCHRAHASAFQSMLRWNQEAPFLTEADTGGNVYWPGIDVTGDNAEYSRGHTNAEMKAGYYDRNPLVFGAYQRSLCNKCHAKD
jgi:predicted CXXCH cytochrome family protein